jgi:hypothetical protein
VFIEVFRALASRQRMFGEMQLAEGEEPESNILQLCPLSKYLDSQAFCKAIVPRAGSWKRPAVEPSSNPTMSANPQVRQVNHHPNQAPGL